MRKVMKVCFVVFMAVLVLLGNCSFAISINSSARSTYLQLEKNAIKSINNAINSNILFDTNFTTAKEKIEIYGENLPSDFNNLKLNVLEEIDMNKNYQYGEIVLATKGGEKLSCEVILKDTVLMMQIPELYEKHISIDFSKLKEICEKFEIEVTEEDINEFNKILSNAQKGSILSKQDEAYLKKIAPKYVKKLNSLITAKYFTMSNNEKIDYSSNSITCKSVSFEITMDEMMKIIDVLINEVKNDKKLIDIFVYLINSNGSERITTEEFVDALNELSQGLKVEAESLEDIKFMSKLYYNTKKEILKRELKIANIALNEESAISLTTIKDSYYELDLGEVKIIDSIKKGINTKEHNISVITKSVNYDYNYDTCEPILKPYTKTENFTVLVETPDKKNTVITFSNEGEEGKLIIKVNLKESTSKKLDCSLEFIGYTNELDYKVFVNYLMEKNIKITQKEFKNPEINIYKMSKEALMNEVQNNQEQVTKKAESIIRQLFPETIKEAEESQIRMVTRMDESTGRMIGKAVRIWYTDVITDPYLGINDTISSTWREYSTFERIEDYIMPNQEASLENGKFYVAMKGYGVNEKILVGISNNGGYDLPNPNSIVEANYDGRKSGIVYVEL